MRFLVVVGQRSVLPPPAAGQGRSWLLEAVTFFSCFPQAPRGLSQGLSLPEAPVTPKSLFLSLLYSSSVIQHSCDRLRPCSTIQAHLSLLGPAD